MRKRSIALSIGAALAACACTPNEYMGISLSAPPTSKEQELLAAGQQMLPMNGANCVDRASKLPIACLLQPASSLAYEAVFGNRYAQLELGKRFESGRGVERDLEKAEKLYKRASKTTGGPMSICSWDDQAKRCHMIQVDLPYQYGLLEASKRLEALQARTAATAGE